MNLRKTSMRPRFKLESISKHAGKTVKKSWGESTRKTLKNLCYKDFQLGEKNARKNKTMELKCNPNILLLTNILDEAKKKKGQSFSNFQFVCNVGNYQITYTDINLKEGSANLSVYQCNNRGSSVNWEQIKETKRVSLQPLNRSQSDRDVIYDEPFVIRPVKKSLEESMYPLSLKEICELFIFDLPSSYNFENRENYYEKNWDNIKFEGDEGYESGSESSKSDAAIPKPLKYKQHLPPWISLHTHHTDEYNASSKDCDDSNFEENFDTSISDSDIDVQFSDNFSLNDYSNFDSNHPLSLFKHPRDSYLNKSVTVSLSSIPKSISSYDFNDLENDFDVSSVESFSDASMSSARSLDSLYESEASSDLSEAPLLKLRVSGENDVDSNETSHATPASTSLKIFHEEGSDQEVRSQDFQTDEEITLLTVALNYDPTNFSDNNGKIGLLLDIFIKGVEKSIPVATILQVVSESTDLKSKIGLNIINKWGNYFSDLFSNNYLDGDIITLNEVIDALLLLGVTKLNGDLNNTIIIPKNLADEQFPLGEVLRYLENHNPSHPLLERCTEKKISNCINQKEMAIIQATETQTNNRKAAKEKKR